VVLGGTLIDGTGRPSVTDAAIVMEGGRFRQVGKRTAVSIPVDAEVVDAKGKTILPGLIDGHCHYRDWVRGELFLEYGVTTCPDLSGHEDPEWIFRQRAAIKKGEIPGPRIWAIGKHVDGPSSPDREVKPSSETTVVTSPEEARQAVRELVESGVDGLKFFEFMTPSLASPAADEAHRLGRPVFGHSMDVFTAANAGYQGVEHSWAIVFSCIQDSRTKANLVRRRLKGPEAIHLGVGNNFLYLQPDFYSYLDPQMFDPIIRVMVANNVHWSPTWANLFWPLSRRAGVLRQKQLTLLQDPRFFTSPLPMVIRVKKIWETYTHFAPERRLQLLDDQNKLQEFARRFVAAGGKIHAGSDPDYIVPAFAVHVELQFLVDAGLSVPQAIQAASLNVAQAWRKDKDYGSVENGKVADLVIVGRDATKDITATQDVKRVFQDGKLVFGAAGFKKP
jgi:imidazolonepropionase-like amidohydrolase